MMSGYLILTAVFLSGVRPKGADARDLDGASRIADRASLLYFFGYFGHGGAPDAKHLGEKFLRQGIALGPVPRLQQPSAEPGPR